MYLGKDPESGETWICTRTGQSIRVRTLRRVTPSQQWKVEDYVRVLYQIPYEQGGNLRTVKPVKKDELPEIKAPLPEHARLPGEPQEDAGLHLEEAPDGHEAEEGELPVDQLPGRFQQEACGLDQDMWEVLPNSDEDEEDDFMDLDEAPQTRQPTRSKESWDHQRGQTSVQVEQAWAPTMTLSLIHI